MATGSARSSGHVIEKIGGRVAYAVMSFGGFLGLGEEEHTIPWNKLTYDTSLGIPHRRHGSSFGVLRPSTGTGITTGRTAIVSANCMINTAPATTGVADSWHRDALG